MGYRADSWAPLKQGHRGARSFVPHHFSIDWPGCAIKKRGSDFFARRTRAPLSMSALFEIGASADVYDREMLFRFERGSKSRFTIAFSRAGQCYSAVMKR